MDHEIEQIGEWGINFSPGFKLGMTKSEGQDAESQADDFGCNVTCCGLSPSQLWPLDFSGAPGRLCSSFESILRFRFRMLWDSRDLGDLGFSALVQPLKHFHSPGTTIATPCWRASQEAAHAAARLLHAKRNSSRGPTLFFTDISSVRYDVCRRVGCVEYYAGSCAAIELHGEVSAPPRALPTLRAMLE